MISAANGTDIRTLIFETDVIIAAKEAPKEEFLSPRRPIFKVSSPSIGMNVLRQLPAETLTTIIGSVSHTKAKVTIGRRDILGLVCVAEKRRSLSSCSISTGPTCPANTAVVVDKIVQTPKSIEVNTTVTFSPKGRMWVQLVNTTEEDIFIPARTALDVPNLPPQSTIIALCVKEGKSMGIEVNHK